MSSDRRGEARLMQRPRVEVDVLVKLTMEEIRALDALRGYGIKPFLEVFYKHMGKAYLEPHEAGLRSLFDTIGSELSPIMSRHDAALKAFAMGDPIIRGRKEHDEMIERIIKQTEERVREELNAAAAAKEQSHEQ